MFCPKCKTEYREGFSVCVDCNCDLVDELPTDKKPEFVGHTHISHMFFAKTIYLILYLAFGICLLYFLLAAAVASKPNLFVILITYTCLWWVLGAAGFFRPNRSIQYFIAIDVIAFLFFFYNLIHDSYIIVWHGVMKGQAIKPGNPLYYRMETIIPALLFVIGLALEGIVSYMLLKNYMLKDRLRNQTAPPNRR